MTQKTKLRLFIEKLIEGEIQYSKVGKSLVNFFNIVYSVYHMVLLQVIVMKAKNGRVDNKYKRDVKDLILNKLTDLSSSLTANQMKAGLERLRVRYAIEEGAMEKLMKGKNIAAAIASILAVLTTVSGFVYKYWKDRKALADAARTNEAFKEVYETDVYPFFEEALAKVLNLKVKNELALKGLFFEGIDDISKVRPQLRPYLQMWGHGV